MGREGERGEGEEEGWGGRERWVKERRRDGEGEGGRVVDTVLYRPPYK